jgi:hypothetical protein
MCYVVTLLQPAGIPLELIKPEALGHKVFEPLLLLGKQRWGFLDIRLRVKGGGHVSQIYGEKRYSMLIYDILHNMTLIRSGRSLCSGRRLQSCSPLQLADGTVVGGDLMRGELASNCRGAATVNGAQQQRQQCGQLWEIRHVKPYAVPCCQSQKCRSYTIAAA